METLSKKFSRESDDSSRNDIRDISPKRKLSKKDNKRKTSTATSRDHDKPKRK